MESAKKQRKKKRPGADLHLAPENFPELNAAFYGMSPHGYLRMRLRSLYLWQGNPDGMFQLMRDGVKFDEMAISTPDENPDDDDEDERRRFTAIELEVLLHHVSETLLRLYIVHAQLPVCPWLEVSRERDFRKFKKQVEELQQRLRNGEEVKRIHQVFHINDDRSAIKPTPDKVIWDASAKNIGRYLDFYASCFLDSSSYNAAKHGLALTAGDHGVHLGVGSDKEPFLSREGQAIEYLSIKQDEDRARWARNLKWVRPKQAIPMIYVGCNLIEAIWNIGSGRYGIKELEELKLFDRPAFDDVMKRGGYEGKGLEGIEMMGLSQTLLYYEPNND